ncbi:MAG: DNA-processing protein DprA [Candidatus Babeliales bacterium]
MPESILLHLNLIDGLGPAIAKRLIACLGPDKLQEIYTYTAHDFKERCAFSEQTAQRLVEGLSVHAVLERELQLLKDNNISWVSFVHPHFPEHLKEIHLPPIGLYVRGTLPTMPSSLAVVGSRDGHKYAQRVIDRVIPPLCERGMVIVSGGARGVDTMAHNAAVACTTPTIAVMGCGLLRITRQDNIELFPHIVRTGGAIVSVYPLLMNANAGHFPARNRIISGLAQGTLVVQAAKKSGALITANYALEQGREVFAIPGPIDDLLSAGCNNLLRQGATLVESHEDILNVLPIFSYAPTQMTIDAQMAQEEGLLAMPVKKADPQTDSLVALCAKPVSVDELSHKLSIDIFEVQTRLFELQMAGRVQQNYAGLWHI